MTRSPLLCIPSALADQLTDLVGRLSTCHRLGVLDLSPGSPYEADKHCSSPHTQPGNTRGRNHTCLGPPGEATDPVSGSIAAHRHAGGPQPLFNYGHGSAGQQFGQDTLAGRTRGWRSPQWCSGAGGLSNGAPGGLGCADDQRASMWPGYVAWVSDSWATEQVCQETQGSLLGFWPCLPSQTPLLMDFDPRTEYIFPCIKIKILFCPSCVCLHLYLMH